MIIILANSWYNDDAIAMQWNNALSKQLSKSWRWRIAHAVEVTAALWNYMPLGSTRSPSRIRSGKFFRMLCFIVENVGFHGFWWISAAFLEFREILLHLYAKHKVFDRGSHFPLFWLGPTEYLHFPLSDGFLWFSRNLSPQPPWKKSLCRIRHCRNLFLIKSFAESLIINLRHLEKKRKSPCSH